MCVGVLTCYSKQNGIQLNVMNVAAGCSMKFLFIIYLVVEEVDLRVYAEAEYHHVEQN